MSFTPEKKPAASHPDALVRAHAGKDDAAMPADLVPSPLFALIGEAEFLLGALTRLELAQNNQPTPLDKDHAAENFDRTTRHLLDQYGAVTERILRQTPQTAAEIRGLLTFFLADRHYRMVDGDRVAALIRSLLRSPLIVAPANDAPAVSSGAPQRRDDDEPRYQLCVDGMPACRGLSFAQARRLAIATLSAQADAPVSIYDSATGIHYF